MMPIPNHHHVLTCLHIHHTCQPQNSLSIVFQFTIYIQKGSIAHNKNNRKFPARVYENEWFTLMTTGKILEQSNINAIGRNSISRTYSRNVGVIMMPYDGILC